MFELLLQADKSMSDGLLDQAERTYWQLIELDPTNAIAVAGLARISLQRGDQRLARTLAARALGIDPESIAARRVLQALDDESQDVAGSTPSDLPLRGAERLEALSRRRSSQLDVDDSADVGSGGKGASRRKLAAGPQASTEARTESARRAGGAAARGKPVEAAKPGGRAPASRPAADSAGRGRPGRLEPLPSEPLPDRRRAGRLAAAAAAAAAAAREPAHARHEPHHAMPSGRRLFEPGQLKTRPSDPFAEAEMAAAVAAVDAMDDSADMTDAGPLRVDRAKAQREEPAEDAEVERSLAAVDATEPDESVALRIALFSEAEEPPASRADASPPAEPASGESFDAAEEAAALAASEQGETTGDAGGPSEAPAVGGSFEAAEEAAMLGAAEREGVSEGVGESTEPAAEIAGDQFEDTAAGVEAITAAPAAATTMDAEAAPPSLENPAQAGEELSEREAELQALREAVAMVMGNDEWSAARAVQPSDGPSGGVTKPEPENAGNVAAEPQPANDPAAAPATATQGAPASSGGQPASPTPTEATPATARQDAEEGGPASSEAAPEASSQGLDQPHAATRKKGLFRRFRGD